MNTSTRSSSLGALLFFLSIANSLWADGGVININVSVKFIQSSTGADPNGSGGAHNFNSDADVRAEIDTGNEVLRQTFRGYRLNLVEIVRIKPTKPAAESDANYWHTLDARSNRSVFEAAAKADKTTWKWHESAINIYINDSGSGQCSFVGSGEAISLGVTVYKINTTLHEIGHFFNLNHTHSGDYADNPPMASPPYLASQLADGDGLSETANDNPNIDNHDKLSQALYAKNYSACNATEQANVDSAYENLMSYHNENQLLEGQMDIWSDIANGPVRHKYVSGTTRFVDYHSTFLQTGTSVFPYGSLASGISNASASGNDIVLVRPGTYTAATLTKAMTIRATRDGPVTIQHP